MRKICHCWYDKTMHIAASEAVSALLVVLYLYILLVMEQTTIWSSSHCQNVTWETTTLLTLTSFVCNQHQPLLISQTISHFLLCQHLICPSQAYFKPPLLPAAQPALGVPEPHWSNSGGAEPVFVQNTGPGRSPLMHWQTVYTCLIGAGVCCA